MPPLDYPSLTILLSLLIGFSITGIIYRTVYMRKWIKDYCRNDLWNALPSPNPVPILGTPENRFIEFTWDQTLWHKNELDRMAIITAAACTAFNEYYDYYELQDKALLYVSTKAIKQMRFQYGPIATCCPSPQWGVEIAITHVDKVPIKEEPKKKRITMEDLWVSDRPEEYRAPLPIPSRYIVVCKNV